MTQTPPTNSTGQKPDEIIRPPLEEFVCLPPAVPFVNSRKLSQASQELITAQQAILQYRPTDKVTLSTVFLPFEDNQEIQIQEEDTSSEIPQFEPIPTQYLEQVPSFAPTLPIPNSVENEELQKILKEHEEERIKLADSFQHERFQLLANYYDGQVREMTQKNDMIDHRPLTEALRYISKRIAYPIDSGAHKFYKYNFRVQKIMNRYNKTVDALKRSREFRSEYLYHKQVQDLNTFSDINNFDVSGIHIPLVPTPEIPEVN